MTTYRQSKATRSKATIADVLHLAADKYLAADSNQYWVNPNANRFSCTAVSDACAELNVPLYQVFKGLKEMGCDTSYALFLKYGDVCHGVNPTVQGMRYMWLKWAALMAEEQGV